MHRTQIYLDNDLYDYLKLEREKTHLTISEIIRRSVKLNVKNHYQTIIAKMENAAGSWPNQKESPTQYISRLRRGRYDTD